MNKSNLLASALLGASLMGASQMAAAHATSIGYENAGPGAVTIWLGTYQHGGHHNEGSLNLVGVLGNPFPSTTVAFNLLVGAGTLSGGGKPAGLIDGVTNFYAPDSNVGGSAPLSGSEAGFLAGCPACGPTNHWQGVTFVGLLAGSYKFTWIPAVSPTAEWSPLNTNMEGIFDLTGVINPPTSVSEPGMLSLLVAGLAVLGFAARRRRQLV